MFVDSKVFNVDIVNEKPMRMKRMVSVILNGVVFGKLARLHKNNVDAMADAILANLSEVVKKQIRSHELPTVDFALRQEIDRRINLPKAI